MLLMLSSLLSLLVTTLYLAASATPWIAVSVSVPVPNRNAGTWSAWMSLTRYDASMSSLSNTVSSSGLATDLSRIFDAWSLTNINAGKLYDTPAWSVNNQNGALGVSMAFFIIGATASLVSSFLGLVVSRYHDVRLAIIVSNLLTVVLGLIATVVASLTNINALAILSAFANVDVTSPGAAAFIAAFIATANSRSTSAYTAFMILAGSPGFGMASLSPGFGLSIAGTVLAFFILILTLMPSATDKIDSRLPAFSSDVAAYTPRRYGDIEAIPARISPELVAARNNAALEGAQRAVNVFDNEILYSARRGGASPRGIEDAAIYQSPDMNRRF